MKAFLCKVGIALCLVLVASTLWTEAFRAVARHQHRSTPAYNLSSITPEQQAAIDELACKFPLDRPLITQRDDEDTRWGLSWCDEVMGDYRMALNPKSDVEKVAHEYAHLMVWNTDGQADHGPLWGVAYAQCYVVLVGD